MNHTTKNQLEHATGVNTTDLAAEKDFIALKVEIEKLDINKYFNVPSSLNNLKAKVGLLDVGELKTVSIDLNKLIDVVKNEVVKNTKFNTLKTKVNKLDKKFPDVTTLIHINGYNMDKKNLEKKNGHIDKKNTRR